MGKPALVCQASELDAILRNALEFNPNNGMMIMTNTSMKHLFQLPSYLADRDFCETDLSIVQFLVYLRVSYTKPSLTIPNGLDQFVFLYQRGKAGEEKKLHDLWSIGLGGHVEEQPTMDYSLFDVLVESAVRELLEEIGVTVTHEEVAKALRQAMLIRDKRTDREAVHLGLCIDIQVNEDQINGEHESDVISNGSWELLRDIQARAVSGEIQLEPWSQVFVGIPLPARYPQSFQ